MKRFITVVFFISLCTFILSANTLAARDYSREQALAGELRELGLFKGVSDNDFALDRAPSRVEALVMLIRVLGKEAEAVGDTWRHPFSDVPAWASNYVGYAYSKGLANGQTASLFGTGQANAQMYLTFVLRALGYSDTNGADFSWKDPFALARSTGILTDAVNTSEFMRGDVVLVSHAALSAKIKSSDLTLSQKLISAGLFHQIKFTSVYNRSTPSVVASPKEKLSAEQIYALCSPAVFFIGVYDENENLISSGSGFFIDDKGTAVTNHHVIDDAHTAVVQLSDTQAVHEIVGVYDYSIDNDWAVIKVDITGNKYLPVNTSQVAGGQAIFAIGSPEGLQNTISEGLVSNPQRIVGKRTFIQISAPISHGSSGGALINTSGEAIGVTSAGYIEGQNLNFAIPMSILASFEQGELIAVRDVLSEGEVQGSDASGTDDSTKDKAFSLLADFVKRNHQSEDAENCLYTHSRTTLKDDGYGFDITTISYNYAKNEIAVTLIDSYYLLSNCYLGFSISPDFVTSPTVYKLDVYEKNSSVIPKTNAQAEVSMADFSKDYEFSFSQYNGSSRKNDEAIAKRMYGKGLDFLNNLFRTYAADGVVYSTYDLGFTSYLTPLSDTQENSSAGNEKNSSVTYYLSTEEILVEDRKSSTVFVDFSAVNVPDTLKLMLSVEDENIASVSWKGENNHTAPLGVIIKGKSAGTTTVEISNRYTGDTAKIKVTVFDKTTEKPPFIEYTLSETTTELKVGKEKTLLLDYDCEYFPDSFELTLETEDENIAEVKWSSDEKYLPRKIVVTAKSKGSTYFTVRNDVNGQYIRGFITVE